MIIILLCLFIAVYLDMALIKGQNRPLFIKVFCISPIKALLGIMFIAFILVFSEDRSSDLPVLILIFIIPLYLLRRQQFMIIIKRNAARYTRLLSDALGVIVMWIYGVIVFGLLMSGLIDLYQDDISPMGDLVASAVFSSILILCLVYRASGNFSDQGFLTNVGLRKGNRHWIKVILVPVMLGLLFALYASYLTVTRKIQPQTPLNEALATTQSLGLILVFLFLAICTAPLIEEIVFRGYFFQVVNEWIGMRKAIYVIALTFALLHVGQYWGDWLAIVMVTLLGFTLTLLRAWTGTTVASVITHYVYNGSVTIIPIIMIALSNPPYFQYKAYYPYHDAQTKENLLKQALTNEPDLADAYNDLAWLYAEEEKNLHMALELAEQALKYAPKQPAYLDTKAEVLEKLGRNDEARLIRARLMGK